MIAARRATSRAVVLLASTLTLTACGADEVADRPSEPPAITVSATISARSVSVSPARFGARTVDLLISNQSPTSRQLVLRSKRLASGEDALEQTTGPINPGGTITLHAKLGEGVYTASVRRSAIAPATITVWPASTDATDDLLAP